VIELCGAGSCADRIGGVLNFQLGKIPNSR
jgi:hypothetical protein